MAGAEGSGAECGCLRVANAWSGAELFCIPRARVVWPDSGGEQTEHTIDVFDVLHLCGIPRQELALCDLLDERGHLLTGDMDVPWRQGEDLHLRLVRNQCPRCTMCGSKCRRMSPHVLCSHGGIEHLWRNVEHCGLSVVDGYLRQAGLWESLPQDTIDAEIRAILLEQSTQGDGAGQGTAPLMGSR